MGTREYTGGIEDELLSPNTMKHQKNQNLKQPHIEKDRHLETGFAFLSELLFLPSKKHPFCHDAVPDEPSPISTRTLVQ
jgi:hypothetical protein